MKKLSGTFKNWLEVQRKYFIECDMEIALRNIQLMRYISACGVVLYILYYLVTYIFFPEMAISPLYALFVPVLLLFFLYSFRASKRLVSRSREAMFFTMLMYISLMIYMIIMSVFPHPDVPSVYYPLFLMLAPVLFILPAYQHMIITVISLPVFYILVLRFKSPECFSHELFEATTAAVFSFLVTFFMTQFRVQTDSLKTKYYNLSRADALTGTMNKIAGENELKEYLRAKPEGERFALLFSDLDGFKAVNDTYGHLEGDRLLRMVGARLITLCGKNDIVSRFGGDEFVILIKNVPERKTAGEKAQGFVNAIADMDFQISLPVTCSIGVYYGDGDSLKVDELLHYADSALYSAKKDGRNRFELYER